MIIVTENKKQIMESDDPKIQKMAYDLFRYLTVRGLPKGYSIPVADETVRQKHAVQYLSGVKEFIEALSNFTSGYAKSMWQDERNNNNADYNSSAYTKIDRILSQTLNIL
jgi:hypothetical protein